MAPATEASSSRLHGNSGSNTARTSQSDNVSSYSFDEQVGGGGLLCCFGRRGHGTPRTRPNQRRPTTTSQDVAPQMRKQDMSSSHQDPSTFSEKQEVQDRVPSQPMQPTDSIEPCQPEPEPIIFTRTLGEHCPMHPHHLCECHTQAQAEAPPLPHHAHTTPAATGSSLRDSDVYLLPTPLGIPNTPPLSQGSSDGETVDIPSPGMAVGYETGEIKPQHCHGHGQQKLMEFEQVGLNRWKSGG